ncbi:Tn3 family transposase post-transcriptional regulator TnpC [Pseudomonas sp. R5(2019)]|uniref:Tn3 family transposase post-transcriptional regulator TnpC n=1 Tax=Pseudomonas sp. R5(2019) TaxID=2697566 RepID=UPI0015B69C1F|nr:Tn3 family transposase post-transcriptional regulator TnpC [Pseudomonas sp. R5(2019)]NBA95237.1 transposase [Pseudomonas sp. R5(2019)]
MHIPPASFCVTPYGDVDAKVLDSLRASYDTAQLLNLVDRLDACLAEIGGVGSIREDFLRLHAMAMTVLEGFPLTVASSDIDSIWEQAMALQEDISALCSCLQAGSKHVAPLAALAPDYQD